MSNDKLAMEVDEFARKASAEQRKVFAAELHKLRARIAEIERWYPELGATDVEKLAREIAIELSLGQLVSADACGPVFRVDADKQEKIAVVLRRSLQPPTAVPKEGQ